MRDYEYIPPKNPGGSHRYITSLPSVYPDGTPAGLRGEAVRTALRSTQCLAWKLGSSSEAAQGSPNLASGVLQLEGKGVLDFLNNKLSNSFVVAGSSTSSTSRSSSAALEFTQACLLTPKGRLVDTLSVAFSKEEAFVLPSPGHTGASLFQRLNPFIFPMDQVKLTDLSNDKDSLIFVLASTQLEHVKAAVQDHFLPKLRELVGVSFELSTNARQSLLVDLDDNGDGTSQLLIEPQTGLPECACVGYTFVFLNDSKGVGKEIWQHLVGDNNPKGPVEIQALEYESLRIEAGQPAFGYEVTGAWKDPTITSPTPLELHQKTGVIDLDKGCYLGQEGIASVLKNPRGPPRSLYTVIFEDENNMYQHQSDEDNSKIDNPTKMPRPGEKLYVLGSNEEIEVGTLTSVAEPYSTGACTIVSLALARRADSILKQMKSKDLQISRGLAANLASPSSFSASINADSASSGIIPPPHMNSLDGLEVIVGGTFTVGMLRGVPTRRCPKGKNMFVDQQQVFLTREDIFDQGYVDIEFSGMSTAEFMDEKRADLESETGENEEEDATLDLPAPTTPEVALGDGDRAEAEAEARKAAKMALLQQRAEEAMARRKEKKLEAEASKVEAASPKDEDDEAAEAIRKAEKMKVLQQRAEEAIARRKKKKEQQG